MKIDLKSIKDLAENIDKYNLSEVLVESDGVKVTLKKEKPQVKTEFIRGNIIASNEVMASSQAIEESTPKAPEENYETINAPMVGTFYRSASPGSPAFVKENQRVEAGETLCILEAMKLMNEVKAHKSCTIIKVLVEDGQIVKKGDKLFAVK